MNPFPKAQVIGRFGDAPASQGPVLPRQVSALTQHELGEADGEPLCQTGEGAQTPP